MSPLFVHERDKAASSEPVVSPGHESIPVDNREDSYSDSGSSERLAWGARTDVGLVRDHNEDSYLVKPPVFAVCDGMGGHAAGEVASAIAVDTISKNAPIHADDIALGAAVEAANTAVLEGPAEGKGRAGMGCTASCALIDESHMAIAHVGDSRIYLLRTGTLVRLTHDHSYVEELVDAGEITADEARVHPSRSVITRALGSDPDMYADHFTIEVATGDRIVLCSDGLSSMVEDSEIEAIAVSTATPQAAADQLVAEALRQGGHDNVSVIVVDVLDDGVIAAHRRGIARRMAGALLFMALIMGVLAGLGALLINNSWYLGTNGSNVAVYQGLQGEFFGFPLSHVITTTSVRVADLPETTQASLSEGVRVNSEDEARATIASYREQIDAAKTAAAETADRTTAATNASPENPAEPQGPDDAAPSEGGGTEGEAKAKASEKSDKSKDDQTAEDAKDDAAVDAKDDKAAETETTEEAKPADDAQAEKPADDAEPQAEDASSEGGEG